MKKSIVSLLCVVSLLLVSVLFVGCGGVDKEYEYNTDIITVENAPVEGEPQIEKITGFVEDTEQTFVELPFAVGETGIEVIAIGSYTGVYNDAGGEEVENALALVVKNTSDKVISYSTFTIEYASDKFATFSPTNLPQNQSSLVFANNAPVNYEDIKKFELTDSMYVPSDELPLLEDVVGVDYKDGEFIITNLTNDDLGDVYVRYKSCSAGNTYLGGITYSVMVEDLKGYETKTVKGDNFDPATSVIVAVENIEM